MFALMCFVPPLPKSLDLTSVLVAAVTPGGNERLKMLRPRNYTVKLYHSLTQIFHHFRQNQARREKGKKIALTANYSLSLDDDFITSTTFHKKGVCEM